MFGFATDSEANSDVEMNSETKTNDRNSRVGIIKELFLTKARRAHRVDRNFDDFFAFFVRENVRMTWFRKP